MAGLKERQLAAVSRRETKKRKTGKIGKGVSANKNKESNKREKKNRGGN